MDHWGLSGSTVAWTRQSTRREFVDIVRELQPRCLINGRVGDYGMDLMGDYQDMNDNGMPAGGLQEYWGNASDAQHNLGL